MTKREEFKRLYRQMRFAHNQLSIMSEFGHIERINTYCRLREFCGRWTVPTIHDSIGGEMFYRRGITYRRSAYAPWRAFEMWMRVN